MALASPSFRNHSRIQSAAKSSPSMNVPEKSSGVAMLQLALTRLGFSLPRTMRRLLPDGIYGKETTAAVKGFQQANGLTVDGIAGAQTWAKLDELFNTTPALPSVPTADQLRLPMIPPQRGQRRPITSPRLKVGPGPNAIVSAPQARQGVVGVGASGRAVAGVITSRLPPGVAAVTGPLVTGATFKKPVIVSPPTTGWTEIGKNSPYNVGVNGPDNDLGKNDVKPGQGNPPKLMSLVYLVASGLPDATLEATWRQAFDKVHGTGKSGSDMIDRFMAATGGSLRHAHGSDLSRTAEATNTFATGRALVHAELKRQVKAMLDAGSVDFRKISIEVFLPFSTGTVDMSVPLRFRAMIGGIHGVKLFTRNFRLLADPALDPVPFLHCDLRYEIGDHFGVGKDDLYTPDLIAMNILQHERAGHAPFINLIDIEETIDVEIT